MIIFSLLSGIYLTVRMSALGEAWPKVAVAALLFIAPFGTITGKPMGTIRRACGTAKAIDSELLGRLQDSLLKISLGIRIAVFVGIVLLMAAKPELWQSVCIVAVS